MKLARHIRRWNNGIRLSATVLLVGGVAAILAYGWMCFDAFFYQTVQHHYFEGVSSSVQAEHPPLVTPPAAISPPYARRLVPFPSLLRPDPAVIARLEIARLNVSVMVREGADAQTLRRAVGHIPATALPGDDGNFVVTGHRDTFFRPLRGILKGDEIRAVTRSHVFLYRVYSLSVVSPDDTHLLAPTSKPECTLITCFPFDRVGPATRRLIVQARLIERTSRSASGAELSAAAQR